MQCLKDPTILHTYDINLSDRALSDSVNLRIKVFGAEMNKPLPPCNFSFLDLTPDSLAAMGCGGALAIKSFINSTCELGALRGGQLVQ